MSGSSRSLLRALENAFEDWYSAADWDSVPPDSIRELYNVVDAYNTRHNTLGSLSTTINDDLRTAYDDYILNASDLSKETFFLELLTRLLPMLSQEDVKLWLRTYLRPALDSAGYELKFVAKARNFIRALANNVLPTEDAQLFLRRRAIASMVMDYILRIYIGKDPTAYDIINLTVSKAEQDTQIHVERIRFIERNAAQLLKDWGSQHPKEYFLLLNSHFRTASKRAKVLSLTAQIASTTHSQVQVIVDSPFFVSLLRSLAFDFSETLLASGFFVLLMLLGKICTRVSPYLLDLLVILARLKLWKSSDEQLLRIQKGLRERSGDDWETVFIDNESTVMQTQIFTNGEFNTLYLLTILYGLYPANFIAFSKAPFEFWKKNPPKIILPQNLPLMELSAIRLTEQLTKPLKRVMLHPNLLLHVSPATELESPIKWILDENNGEDVREEDVLIACLQLNPDVILSIPDELLLPNNLLKKIYSSASFNSDFYDRRVVNAGPVILLPGSDRGSFQLSFEELLIIGTPRMGFPSHWPNADRRLSIVPTNLVLANPKEQDESEAIRFKHFDFSGTGVEQKPTLDNEDEKVAQESKTRDSLGELYAVHEKLYTPHSANNSALSSSLAHKASGNFQHTNGTASDMLNKQLRADTTLDASKEVLLQLSGTETLSPGSALDFYQRELLLMKNETEFSSYMKHLNKFNYLKLKLRYNKVIKALESEKLFLEHQKLYQLELSQQMEQSKQMQVEKEVAIAEMTDANSKLSNKVKELQTKVSEQLEVVVELQQHLDDINSELESCQSELLAKEAEEVQLMYASKTGNAPIPIQSDATETKADLTLPLVSDKEKEILDARTEISILQEQLRQALADLDKTTEELELTVKSYEKKLGSIKFDIGDAVREQSVHYERKIQELNTVLVKFEAALEEKNTRILQLSTTKPIRIPEPGSDIGMAKPTFFKSNDGRSGHMHDFFRERGSSSADSLSLASIPSMTPRQPLFLPSSRQNSSPSIPIVKGRGGYQKRSKKM